MDRRAKDKLLALKIHVLEEQRNQMHTVMSATDKVLALANDWARDADAGSDVTFEEISCLLEEMILFLGDEYADLPEEFNGFETFNLREMQKAVSCLTINPRNTQQKQLEKAEHIGNTQCLDKDTEQECVTDRKQDRELLTDRQTDGRTVIQTVLKAQADIEKNSHLIQTIMKDQKENSEKHEQELEKLNEQLDNIVDDIQALGTRIGIVETNTVDHTQFSDLQMRCEILEVNSESLQCRFEDQDSVIQDLTNRVEEASENQTPVIDFQNLQKAEEKVKLFEEEWNKTKEEVGKLYNDFETKNQILCQIIADKLAPLQRLRDIFNKQLNVRKNNRKKLDTVCNQMADLLPKFLQHQSVCEKHFVGFIVHKSLTSQPVANSVVYFTEIISNFGNHFNIGSGIFTSSSDGLYAVCLNINGDKDVTVSLVKQPNGSVLSRSLLPEEIILSKVTTTTNSFTSSAFIVVDLKADDKLCVKYGDVDTGSKMLGDSTFACFRIGSLE